MMSMYILHFTCTIHCLSNFRDRELVIAEGAYKQAVIFCKQELKNDKKGWSMWLDNSSSASDVVDIVRHARTKYEKKRRSAVSSIWSALSSRIVYYKDILDMLVQQHPEYVSLAWGAMKFLFVVSFSQCLNTVPFLISSRGYA